MEQDYVADWNRIAEGRHWPKLRALTPNRKAKLATRELEAAWDWEELCALLSSPAQVSDSWVDGFTGFGFDWVILNGHNYVKILEGKYRERFGRTPRNGDGPQPASLTREKAHLEQVLVALQQKTEAHGGRTTVLGELFYFAALRVEGIWADARDGKVEPGPLAERCNELEGRVAKAVTKHGGTLSGVPDFSPWGKGR